MAYNEHSKNATLKYKKEKQHPVSLSYKKDEWEMEIEPAIRASGMAVATYFKLAVEEKMKRDQEKAKEAKVKEHGEKRSFPFDAFKDGNEFMADDFDEIPEGFDVSRKEH